MKNNKTKPQQYRSSRSPMFLKKGARKNFANPTGLKRIEKKLQYWRSLVKSAKSPRTPLSAEHLRWLLPTATAQDNNNKKYITVQCP